MQEIKIEKVGEFWNTYTIDRRGHMAFKSLVAQSKTKAKAENWREGQCVRKQKESEK